MHPAFWGSGMVSLGVTTIVVHQVVTLSPFQCPILLPGQAAGAVRRGGQRAAPPRRIGGATARLEIRELSDERLVPVIRLVFSILSCPGGCIPDGSIYPHWP